MRDDEGDANSAMRFALRISVAIVFAVTGLEKFGSDAHWLRVFAAIGLGDWFRYFTGVVETVGGLLFLIPATTTIGAGLLVSAMVGAMAVHIVIFKHPLDSLFPGVYLVGVLLAYAKLRVTKNASTR